MTALLLSILNPTYLVLDGPFEGGCDVGWDNCPSWLGAGYVEGGILLRGVVLREVASRFRRFSSGSDSFRTKRARRKLTPLRAAAIRNG